MDKQYINSIGFILYNYRVTYNIDFYNIDSYYICLQGDRYAWALMPDFEDCKRVLKDLDNPNSFIIKGIEHINV